MKLFLSSRLLICVLLLAMLPDSNLNAQSDPDRSQQLRSFSAEQSAKWQEARREVLEYAEERGIEIRKELDDGRVMELMRFDDGFPVYYVTQNRSSAITSSVIEIWPGGETGLELTGAGQMLGIWEGGVPDTDHQEFTDNRLIIRDDVSSSDHATHVGGTMIAAGVDEDAKGMAHEGELLAYTWSNTLSNMADAADQDNLLVANHSWGSVRGWSDRHDPGNWRWYGDPEVSETEDYLFGFYSETSREWDELANNAPELVMVNSAGNTRLSGPDEQPVSHEVWDPDEEDWVTSTTERNLDGEPHGYQTIGSKSTAKNVLSVGAVHPIDDGYEQPGDVDLGSFSSWGPTDDGRVKPDIVAQGTNVYSPVTGSSSYGTMQGTSMSAPVVSGTVALLQELYRDLHQEDPKSATIRALLFHTVDQAGFNEGPDYRFGWGLMNGQRAAETLNAASQSNSGHVVMETELDEGQTYEYTLTSDGDGPLQATLAWTDPEGEPPSAQLNPDDIMLVNDLDLRIEGPNGQTYEPFILDPDNPDDPATTGDNIRDIAEKVLVEDTQEGEYIVRVTHKGNLDDGSQPFSLIISDDVEDPFEIPFAGGMGTEDDPYQVATADQLAEVGNYLGNHFIVTADIDAASLGDLEPIGTYFPESHDGVYFENTFDGNGHVISNLSVYNDEGATGMFAATSSSAVINNLTLENIQVVSEGENIETGGLAGRIFGEVRDVHVTGSVESDGNFVGGIVGLSWNGHISNSTSGVKVTGQAGTGGILGSNSGGGDSELLNSHTTEHASVSGSGTVGGVLGRNSDGTVEDVSNYANVIGSGGGVGGVVGSNSDPLENAYNTGDVEAGGQSMGGVAGVNSGTIYRVYNTGTFTGNDFTSGGIVGQNTSSGVLQDAYNFGDGVTSGNGGGAVGWNNGGTLNSSYSTGFTDTGIRTGGLIGHNEGTVNDSYWDMDSRDDDDGVGDGSTDGVEGLTEDEITGAAAQDNMSGLDFVDVWETVEEGNMDADADGYPILQILDRQQQIDAQQQQEPAIVELHQPEDEAVSVSTDPELVWNAAARADTYHLQVSDESDFNNLLVDNEDITDTQFQLEQELDNETTYYWQVRAHNENGFGNWSEARSFTTTVDAPEVVELEAPEDESTDIPVTPELQWNESERAESYQLRIAGDSDFDEIIDDITDISGTSVSPDELQHNATYYWKVRAHNTGGESEWSDAWSFTTEFGLDTPVLAHPEEGAEDVSIPANLHWHPVEDATDYKLQVATNEDFDNQLELGNSEDLAEQIADGNETQSEDWTISQKVAALDFSNEYFWRVRAFNDDLKSDWSEARSLNTESAPITTPVTLISPDDEESEIPFPVELSWEEFEDADHYDIQISESSEFRSVHGEYEFEGTGFSTPDLKDTTSYYWRVRATVDGEKSVWSEVRTFETAFSGEEITEAPQLVSPEDEGDRKPLAAYLMWESVVHAEEYDIEVATDSDFDELIYPETGEQAKLAYSEGENSTNQSDEETLRAFKIEELEYHTTYYWRVRGTNPNSEGDWSEIRSFTTLRDTEGGPELAAPADGEDDAGFPVELDWQAYEDADHYDLQISESPDFEQSTTVYSFDQTEFTASDLADTTTYFWRVRATVDEQKTTWSEVWTFTTGIKDPQITDAPELDAPSDQVEEVEFPINLSWQEFDNADSYDIELSQSAEFDTLRAVRDFEGTSYEFADLADSTLYYWRIRANVEGEKSAWSEAWSFETEFRPPEVPSWQPEDEADEVETDLLVEWGESERAETYALQLSEDEDFESFVVDEEGLEETEFKVTDLDGNTTYHWRVEAHNKSGGSGWSDPLSFTTEDVVSADDEEEIPDEFALGDNYPNPFNPTTQITYSLPEQADVTLEVFDILGRPVATLVDEQQQAGRYEVSFDASSLSSGAYIYRIQADEFVETRQMMFVK